jgi:RNA ligase (TIGR02306 family)
MVICSSERSNCIMSTFAVTIERISNVWEHTNAERLEMARLASMSYQFVIAKGSYKQGDLVVYFPIDSVLPAPLIEAIGLTGKLAGPNKDRIKTVRLRGEISQGIVASPKAVVPDWDSANYHEGQDITELLGVIKYEPPPVSSHAGNLIPLPQLVSVYDIEGAERFAEQVETYLLDVPVMITEKAEGSHFAVSLYANDDIAVSQRRHRIEPIDGAEHDWHKAARTSGLIDKLPPLKAEIEHLLGHAVEVVTVRGEMIGTFIQGNYYQLPAQQIKVFEIEANGLPLDAEPYLSLVEKFEIDIVPLLASNVTLRDWLAGRTLAEASNGISVINPAVMREGIVIRPLIESTNEVLGRVIIKQRSPEYLAVSDY